MLHNHGALQQAGARMADDEDEGEEGRPAWDWIIADEVSRKKKAR